MYLLLLTLGKPKGPDKGFETKLTSWELGKHNEGGSAPGSSGGKIEFSTSFITSNMYRDMQSRW